MIISIPTTGYVRRYLLNEYGPDPYYLDVDPKNRLRLEFLSVHIHTPYSSLYTHASIQIDIGDSKLLSDYYSQNKIQFDRGVFGAHEFFCAFYHQVEAMYKMGKEMGLSLSQMNYRIAIEKFMDRYQISEEEYSYDNLYRQFSRQKRVRKKYQKNRPWKNPERGVFQIRLKPRYFFTGNALKK